MTSHRAAFLVTALCWSVVVFDGYDLIVYGTVLPVLLHEPGWGLTKSGAGLLGSLAFAGMLVGAVLAGTLCGRLGRRGTIIGCAACGFGRIGAVLAPQVGGLLLAAGMGVNSNFLVFAIAAAIAGSLLLVTPRRAAEAPASRVPALKPGIVSAYHVH
jgi:MFS family permease